MTVEAFPTKAFPKRERRRGIARCHPMRRAGDAPDRDRSGPSTSARPQSASADLMRHDAGFVAHLVAAQLQARAGMKLHHVAQHFAARAYARGG